MSTDTLDLPTTMNAQSVNVKELFPKTEKNISRRVTNVRRNSLGQLEGTIRFDATTWNVVRPRHSKHWKLA